MKNSRRVVKGRMHQPLLSKEVHSYPRQKASTSHDNGDDLVGLTSASEVENILSDKKDEPTIANPLCVTIEVSLHVDTLRTTQ